MNVVDFFKQQVERWNDDMACGFCWEFDAPLTDSGVNESVMQTDAEECCPVKAFITNYTFRHNRTYNPTTTMLTNDSIDHTLTLHILAFDRVDTNVYQEQIGHPVSEGKWETILNPLRQCVCEESLLEFCEIINKRILITAWNAVARINWLDNNYTGWSITMTLRDYDCTDDNTITS